MFLADENIPLEVVKALRDDGINIISASDVCQGVSDVEVLTIAKQHNRTIITFDKDFGFIIFRNKINSSGMVLLRIHPQSKELIYTTIRKVARMNNINFKDSFCVVEQRRIRVIPLNNDNNEKR